MTDPLPLLDVAGPPHARGVAQGVACGPAIAAHAQALLSVWRRQGLADPRAYRARLLRETRFEAAIEAHVLHLMREVEGMAEGAGVPRETVYALQLLDEEWAFRRRLHGAPPLQKYSSLALHDAQAGVTWIGQNMDLGAYTDGFQLAVRHAPADGRPGAVVTTTAGVLALLGVNDAGVGVCVNSIPQVPSAAEGIPVAIMIRRLLEVRSAAEAAEACRALPHATNQHYLIADAKRIVSLEASSEGVREHRPPRPDRVLHTNHPLADAPRCPDGEENSVARLRSLDGRLGEGRATCEMLQAALSAFDDAEHPVCRLRSDELGPISFTTASMISALRPAPAPVEGLVSFGPPSERGCRPSRSRTLPPRRREAEGLRSRGAPFPFDTPRPQPGARWSR